VSADFEEEDYQAVLGVSDATQAVQQPSPSTRHHQSLPSSQLEAGQQQGRQNHGVSLHKPDQMRVHGQQGEQGRSTEKVGGQQQQDHLRDRTREQGERDKYEVDSGHTASEQEAVAEAEENVPWVLLTLGKALRMVQGELRIPADEDARHTSHL
jgi:hypothetical protein